MKPVNHLSIEEFTRRMVAVSIPASTKIEVLNFKTHLADKTRSEIVRNPDKMSRTSRGKIANEFVDENNQVDDNNNYYYADNNDVAVIIDEAYVIM